MPYKDISYLLGPSTNVGGLTATPSTIRGRPGVPTGYTLSWSGLAPGSEYLGVVHYGEAEATTAVSVTTG